MRKSLLNRYRIVLIAIAASLVACGGEYEEPGPPGEDPVGQLELAASTVAQNAINFGLSQRSSVIGSVYVGGCTSQRFGGTTGGYFNGSCVGQSNYYQSPGTVGYDCSGLIHRMFKEAGINLGSIDSSSEMYSQLTSITKAQLLPGDLLVKPGSHVAMYIGDTNGNGVTEIIEATPYQNNGSITYNGSTYRKNWYGVRIAAASTYINDGAYYARRVSGVQNPPPPPPTGWGPLYRYYNSATTDHFYTRDWSELGSGQGGFVYERTEGQIAGSQVAGTVPLYRLYYPNRDHYYTLSWADKNNAEAAGWNYEGVAGYVLPPTSSLAGAKPVYRYWNASSWDHFYTLTPVNAPGYTYEMVVWKSP